MTRGVYPSLNFSQSLDLVHEDSFSEWQKMGKKYRLKSQKKKTKKEDTNWRRVRERRYSWGKIDKDGTEAEIDRECHTQKETRLMSWKWSNR